MELLGRTENKINEDKNGENVPQIENTEVCFTEITRLFQINHLVAY